MVGKVSHSYYCIEDDKLIIQVIIPQEDGLPRVIEKVLDLGQVDFWEMVRNAAIKIETIHYGISKDSEIEENKRVFHKQVSEAFKKVIESLDNIPGVESISDNENFD